jgi:lactoylglutathione lyase
MTRPFRILGVQHIAIGALNRAALRRLWIDLLGLPVVGAFRSAQENVEEDILAVGEGPLAVQLDLMQPLDAKARPSVHLPALHHFGLWVDDLASAAKWLAQQGVRLAPGGIRKGASGHEVCFIHPRSSELSPIGGEGVLIELVQAPPAVIAACKGEG